MANDDEEKEIAEDIREEVSESLEEKLDDTGSITMADGAQDPLAIPADQMGDTIQESDDEVIDADIEVEPSEELKEIMTDEAEAPEVSAPAVEKLRGCSW